jgi:hypothetical protein
LNRTYDDKGNFSFSYSPLDTSVVFNASLLGSKLLSRLFTYTGEHFLLEEAKKVLHFVVTISKQMELGLMVHTIFIIDRQPSYCI